MTRMRSSSTTVTLKLLALDMYIPVPIILALRPDIVSISVFIPANIVSAVTAVSASKGVGSGLTSLRLAFTEVVS